jgi:hypothetical protein
VPFQRVVFPPWVYKLPMSQDFNRNSFSEVLAAVAGTAITPVALTFELPPNAVGYIQIFGIYTLTQSALTDVTWTLRVNDGPVSGWDNIRNPPGVANLFAQNFSDLQVRIPAGGTVSILITNNTAQGPWTVGGKIAGWYHPEIEEKRIYGSL